MKLRTYFSLLLACFSLSLLADTEETVKVAGTNVNNFATSIVFAGDRVTLSYADGTSQTEDMSDVQISFGYTAKLSEAAGFDNLSTLKTFGKRLVNVHVVRSIKKDQWNTICLPFDMPAAAIAEVFGEGTMVAEFDVESNGNVNFNTVESMLCGIPYLIQPAEEVAEFTLQDIMLSNLVSGNTVLGTEYHFVGTILDEVPEGNIYYFANGNKVKKLAAGNTIKPFHAYLAALNSESSVTSFSIDNDLLGIEHVNFERVQGNRGVYSLGGQLLGQSTVGLPKGVYIVNGRKVVVK